MVLLPVGKWLHNSLPTNYVVSISWQQGGKDLFAILNGNQQMHSQTEDSCKILTNFFAWQSKLNISR